jgi:hypothetical protein
VTDADPATWPHGSADAIGQTGEFLVWAHLIGQSRGGLHVFLPMLDRGIDGLVHRLADAAYLALQVKTKTSLKSSEGPIAVYENHLFTDDQLIVGVSLEGDRLGPYALVADGSTYKKKAARIVDRGRTMLVADMPVRPIPGHKWSEDLVPVEELASRLGVGRATLVTPTPLPSEPSPEEDKIIGFWGELEVCRRLATLEDCCVFRPFPDNEISEVVVRRLASGATIGIQVKTIQLGRAHAYGNILVSRASFVAAPSTLLVALGWVVPERRFHETCLLIPTEELPSLAGTSGPYYELHFRPDGSGKRGVSRQPARFATLVKSLDIQTFVRRMNSDGWVGRQHTYGLRNGVARSGDRPVLRSACDWPLGIGFGWRADPPPSPMRPPGARVLPDRGGVRRHRRIRPARLGLTHPLDPA